jgi:hypothetical protein
MLIEDPLIYGKIGKTRRIEIVGGHYFKICHDFIPCKKCNDKMPPFISIVFFIKISFVVN